MSNYYVRADGVAPKTSANDPTSIATSMSLATLAASTFSPGDVINISSRGGDLTPYTSLSGTFIFPSGGDAPGREIVYQGEPGFEGAFNGEGHDFILTRIYEKGNIILKNFSFENLSAESNWSSCSIGQLGAPSYNILATGIRGVDNPGSTVFEVIGDAHVIINDSYFGNTVTHAIGMHDNAVLETNRCVVTNPKINAIHTIHNTTIVCNDWKVFNGNSYSVFAAAFNFESSIEGVVNRPFVEVSANYRSAFSGKLKADRPVVIIKDSANVDSPVVQQNSAYTMQLNNGTFIDRRTTKGKCIAGSNNVSAIINVNNCLVKDFASFAVLAGTLVVVNVDKCSKYPASMAELPWSGTLNKLTPFITSDPQLIGGNNYNLKPTSPCINAGKLIAGALTTDYERKPVSSFPDIGAFEWLSAGSFAAAPVVNDGPPRNNITRLTGTSATINPTDTYKLADTNACRIITEWAAGTANFAFDANGVPIPFTGQQLIDAGIGPRLYCGSKGVAGYVVDQDAPTNAKIIKILKVPTYIDTLYWADYQEVNWEPTSGE